MKRWAGGFLLSPVFHYMSDIYENFFIPVEGGQAGGNQREVRGFFSWLAFVWL